MFSGGRIQSPYLPSVPDTLSIPSSGVPSRRPAENRHLCLFQTLFRKESALSLTQKRAGHPSVRRTGPRQGRTSCLTSPHVSSLHAQAPAPGPGSVSAPAPVPAPGSVSAPVPVPAPGSVSAPVPIPSPSSVHPRFSASSLRSSSLTVEAALEFPFFFLCMIFLLHTCQVCRASVQFSGRMTQAAEQLALLSYSKAYEDTHGILRGALSDAWVHSQVLSKTDDQAAVKNASFLLSSYLKEDSKISLVLTYQPNPPVGIIRLPWTFWIQKITIRGWTGREGLTGKDREGAGSQADKHTVYVTEHGRVYHTDPDCSHLKLTITSISKSKLKTARNFNGSKYKRCPYCGRKACGDSVLINPYGTAWHTSASCPGLKRTIQEVPLGEVGGLHECKDCAKRRQGG